MRKIFTMGAAAAVILGVAVTPVASAASTPVPPPPVAANYAGPNQADLPEDQLEPLYTPAEVGKIRKLTKAEFAAAMVQAGKDSQARQAKLKKSGLSAKAMTAAVSEEADFDAQLSEAGATSSRTARSYTKICTDPYVSGTKTQFSIAWDDIGVHNSTGWHSYVQPRPGTGWFVARTYSGQTRYIGEMNYYNAHTGGSFSRQTPNTAPSNIPNGSAGRVFNNAEGVSGVHQGRLGTGSTWWTGQDVLNVSTATSWFRGIVRSDPLNGNGSGQIYRAMVIMWYGNSVARSYDHLVGIFFGNLPVTICNQDDVALWSS